MTRHPTEDRNLLSAAVAGDARAFVQLLQEYDHPLRALVYGIVRDRDTMDDVLQEAYLKAYRSLGSFDSRSSFRTWIYRIAANAAIDEVRRRRPVTTIDGHDEPVARHRPDEEASDRTDIDRALDRLPADQRSVVLLVDGHGFDYAATADLLDIRPGTVGSRLHQARATLRSLLITAEGPNR